NLVGKNFLTLSSSAAGGPTIGVNKATITASVSVPLAGVQGLTKSGRGTLVLLAANGYSGGTTITDGTLDVNADAALGIGPVTITSANSGDRFVNFTNSGVLNVAAGVNTNGTSTTVNFNGMTNQGSGSITIGAASQLNVATFQSYGTLKLNPATVGSGQATL